MRAKESESEKEKERERERGRVVDKSVYVDRRENTAWRYLSACQHDERGW